MTRGRKVKVDGDGLKNVVAVDNRWVDVFVEFSGVERGVVKLADGEGDDVSSCRSEVVSSPHDVLGEGHMGVEVKTGASAPASTARGPPIAPSASVQCGVVIGGAVIVVRHAVGR